MDLRSIPAFFPLPAAPRVAAALIVIGSIPLIALPAARAADTYTAARKSNVPSGEVYGAAITASTFNTTPAADTGTGFVRARGTSSTQTGFRSFTVLTFANSAFGLPASTPIADITGVRLDFNATNEPTLLQFQGSLEQFQAAETGALPTALRYNQANAVPNGIPTTTTAGNNGGQNAGDIFSLGTVSTAALPSNGAISLSLTSLNAAGEGFLIQALNSGQDLRLIVAAADATSVAAWRMDNSVASNRPIFSITASIGSGTAVVPEAGTATLLGMAGMFASASALVVRRRRCCDSSKA